MNRVFKVGHSIFEIDLFAEEMDELYQQGYRFICEGNYATLNSIDGWSGMPNTTCNLYVFTDKDEAEAFAKQQKWVFNSDICAEVYDIPEHTESRDEASARYQREREQERESKKQRALDREIARATAAGMSLEDYRKTKKYIKYLRENEEEIADYARSIALLQARNADIRKWLEAHPLP